MKTDKKNINSKKKHIIINNNKRKKENISYLRYIELTLIFILGPLIVYLELFPLYKILGLILLLIICSIVLWKDKEFKLKNELKFKKEDFKQMMIRFIAIGLGLSFVVYHLKPDTFFMFPREVFFIWLMVMILYPILSALPQEIIWRTYYFHRFKDIFTNRKVMILTNSFFFAFLHIIYDNPISVILTLFAGFIFATTYDKSKSLTLVTIEHALYGMLVFTIGIGEFFYEGDRGGE